MNRPDQSVTLVIPEPNVLDAVEQAVESFRDLFAESVIYGVDAQAGDDGWRVTVEGQGRVE